MPVDDEYVKMIRMNYPNCSIGSIGSICSILKLMIQIMSRGCNLTCIQSSESSPDSGLPMTTSKPSPAAAAAVNSGSSSSSTAEYRSVRTLYACVAEHETELSFEPNQIITSGELHPQNL